LERIAAPQPLKAQLRRLRKAQRVLSRKHRGSKAHNRARLEVARVHRKVANVRKDWQWKHARELVERFDFLVFETLNLKGMQQLWGRKVSDLGFADFLRNAEWLARKLGRDLIKIDQWEPSTKACRVCDRQREMPLNMRMFVCDDCGHVEHRDENVSHNILEAGRRLRSGASSKTTYGWQDASVTAESHAL
jgi:putative transposase